MRAGSVQIWEQISGFVLQQKISVILALEKRLIAIRSLKRNVLEAETVSLAVAS